MYAISSVNEGKYRVVADSLSTAFGGPPRSITPVQLGQVAAARRRLRPSLADRPPARAAGRRRPHPRRKCRSAASAAVDRRRQPQQAAATRAGQRRPQLQRAGRRIEQALSGLVAAGAGARAPRRRLTSRSRSRATCCSPAASPCPAPLARGHRSRSSPACCATAPNAVRVEGYTDDQPIAHRAVPARTGSCRRRARPAWCTC